MDDRLARDAMTALGNDDDARAILRDARLVVGAPRSSWSGTNGEVQAYEVVLGLSAHALGTLRAHPHLEDALCAAVAAALSHRPGAALAALVPAWTHEIEDGAAYRSDSAVDARREDPDALRAAASAYLRAAGDEALASAVERAHVTTEPAVLTLGHRDARALTRDARASLLRCLRDLAGDDAEVRG